MHFVKSSTTSNVGKKSRSSFKVHWRAVKTSSEAFPWAHTPLEKPYTCEGDEVIDAVFNTKEHEAPTTPEINMVVKQVAEATKQTFNLMLGLKPIFLKSTISKPVQ